MVNLNWMNRRTSPDEERDLANQYSYGPTFDEPANIATLPKGADLESTWQLTASVPASQLNYNRHLSPAAGPIRIGDGSFIGRGPNDVRHDHGNTGSFTGEEPQVLEEDDFGPRIESPTREQELEEAKDMAEFQRQRADKQRDELAAFKKAQDETIRELETRYEEAAEQNKRGEPTPPDLALKIYPSLYPSLLDRLIESTVHVCISRAQITTLLGKPTFCEDHAKVALHFAKQLKYKPLSAWCHYHIGIGYIHQRRYEEAVASFEKAVPAGGLYVEEKKIDRWLARARAGDVRRRRGSESSEEKSPPRGGDGWREGGGVGIPGDSSPLVGGRGGNLQDELMGSGWSESSKGSEDYGEVEGIC